MKYYRMNRPNGERFTLCPVCGNKNDHLATANNCEHLYKIDRNGVVFYYWNFDPKVERNRQLAEQMKTKIQVTPAVARLNSALEHADKLSNYRLDRLEPWELVIWLHGRGESAAAIELQEAAQAVEITQ